MTTRAPTPTGLADAWRSRYEQAVRDAAGRDGRISRAEAARMTEGTPEQREAADNVSAFFDRTGQRSVSAERFVAAEHARIVDEAGRVAGRGGRVSLLETRLLPRELQEDVRQIRQAPAQPAPSPNPPPRPAGLPAAIAIAAAGMTFPSESDAVVRAVTAADPQRRPITPALVVDLFGADSAALGRDIFGPNSSLPSIVGRASETRDAHALLLRLSTSMDPSDPASVAGAQRWSDLKGMLEGNLTELTALRFGERRQNGGIGLDVGVFIVGRHNNGDVVGIYTGSVET